MSNISSILYYKLFPVNDPTLFRLWQRDLCEKLDLKGRIIVSEQGINGTLGGHRKALKQYLLACREWEALGDVEVKWTHNLPKVPFPKLSVKHRSELVTFNAQDEIKIAPEGVINAGVHLGADELHALLDTIATETGLAKEELSGKEVLFFDGRNTYEWELGRFKNSFDPGVNNAKEFIEVIESGVLDEWKDKPVITYCTGGIRCELLTPLMKNRGFSQVYQIDGGIFRYLENSKNSEDLWEGAVYTFDTRKKIFEGIGSTVGACCHCKDSTEEQHNCRSCGKQVLSCDSCWDEARTCSNCN